ncbi:MAG TPA: TIGR00269 family protein [Thermoplasmata archaeon]|nr:TIGR00269 family protein [Thermoplasmata archaeon]
MQTTPSRCDRCSASAVIDQPYRRAHLCSEHFLDSVRERARREIHRQLPGFRGGQVAVAVSGGKDSAVALALAHAFFRHRPSVRITALTVDEGIAGYRNVGVAAADRLAKSLGVEHRVLRAVDVLGTTTDDAAVALPMVAPCSFCGVWRRQLLNRAARELGADALVLGFNLDDLAQTVLMNVARGEVDRLGRMAPHRHRQPGFVPRIAPLSTVPEREVFLFARLSALPFDHQECPHAARAARNVFREVVWRLEEAIPGTRQSLLRSRERVAELLDDRPVRSGVVRCPDCGEPASGGRCRSCDYLSRLPNTLIPLPG